MNRHLAIVLAAAAAALALPSAATAQTTIGSGRPAAAVGVHCPGNYLLIPQDIPSGIPSYSVPASGGEIYQWGVDAEGGVAGTAAALVVIRPSDAGYTVIGFDAQAVPSGADGPVTFDAATPIAVRGGDIIGLQAGGIACSFGLGTDRGGTIAVAHVSGLAAGQTVGPALYSPPGFIVNVSARVRGLQDVAVTPRAEDSGVTPGSLTALHATVTNRGPGRETIEFTDVVPDGLAIRSVVAGSGQCRVEGQKVTCWISGLVPGDSAPVVINVVPAAAGVYLNTASVRPLEGVRDPDPSDNGGTVGLTVRAVPPSGGGGGGAPSTRVSQPSAARCVVPVLRGTPLRVAKPVLRELGCTVGKVKRVRSRTVRKGAVIRTSPAASTQPAGTKVTLRVSRGRKRGAR